MNHVTEGLSRVRQSIAQAAERAGRNPEEVRLVAVGKTHPPELVAAAVAAGVTDLGENRVQEAAAKKPLVPPATWHLIGPLQRNKARLALETFDLIHTVDRWEIVDRLELLLDRHWPTRRQPVLVEVNIGDEPQKAGVPPHKAGDLVASVHTAPHLDLRGLMVIPPFDLEPEGSREYFRQLRLLRDRLQDSLSLALPELSMGMSHDYEAAIAEGATMVRIGTAIFGARELG
jgi:pyridoxal phosphate enzyme (YggS family)